MLSIARSVHPSTPAASSITGGASRRPPAYGVGVVDGPPIQRREGGVSSARPSASTSGSAGLPTGLRSGVEHLSGVDLGDVRVHYGSAQPARLGALAFTRGSAIHVGPGQERHLPHEAWHVVQQRQGRVTASRSLGGHAMNDDAGLEREADRMGSLALRSTGPSPSASRSPRHVGGGGDVMQCVLATVDPQNGPIVLTENGGFMHNAGQPAGQAVTNEVGFSEVLDAGSWGGFGKSDRNYHRAHGYAQSFGGAGGHANVAWWWKNLEENWTTLEQKVRGGGINQIDAWKPNTNEVGNYQVDRTLQAQADITTPFVDGLMVGVNWGLADARAAWGRATAGQAAKPDRFTLATLNGAKAGLAAAARGHIQNWVNSVFGTAETHIIDTMRMRYTITNTGNNDAGRDHGDVDQTFNAPALDATKFGLKTNNPQGLWTKMFTHNVGSFARGASPLANFTANVPSLKPHDPGVDLFASADGFGL